MGANNSSVSSWGVAIKISKKILISVFSIIPAILQNLTFLLKNITAILFENGRMSLEM